MDWFFWHFLRKFEIFLFLCYLFVELDSEPSKPSLGPVCTQSQCDLQMAKIYIYLILTIRSYRPVYIAGDTSFSLPFNIERR